MNNRPLYITGARLVLRDQVLENSAMLVEHGRIVSIDSGGAAGAEQLDLAGQTLLPGLIDLHCDAIEKEVEPRSRVFFPIDFAVAQVDRRNAAAGITTPFHALSFSAQESGVRNNQIAAAIVRAIKLAAPASLVDNRVHCRYEVTDPTSVAVLCELLEEGLVDMLSVMDHSPGQGQFKTLDAFVDYMKGNHGMDHDTALAAAQLKLDAREGALQRIETLLAVARRRGVATASHDDDSPQRVRAMHELGVHISEFPINPEAAATAIALGLPTILGAPNVLRGQSQSGSMRAIDAIQAGSASCLCSDYQPSTLVAAAFAVEKTGVLGLPDAVALVSANPAAACNLTDRGYLAPGMRADLIAVSHHGSWPSVTRTWSRGVQVFSAGRAPS
jgi:alpha-D-ribose 1-methylphosphonate 5-triphosphate diphosphatase